jgi:hypothetical protein
MFKGHYGIGISKVETLISPKSESLRAVKQLYLSINVVLCIVYQKGRVKGYVFNTGKEGIGRQN